MGRGEGNWRGPDETISVEEHRSDLAGRSYLLVIENGSSSRFEPPGTGVVVIGRGPDADLRLDHTSVSRRHAQLLVERGAMRIADMGSRNGTRVNGESLTGAHVLATGDVVAIGEVYLVVHAPPRCLPPRDPLDERGWRQRLAQEVERAVICGRPFAVVAIAGVPSAARADAVAALTASLRGMDTAGIADDGQLLVLLPELDQSSARRMAAGICRALDAPEARAGVATCPWDATDPDSLVVAARAGAGAASVGGVAAAGEAALRLELGEREVLIADPAMVRVFELLARLAAADLPVLIMGETGSGKENAAYAVHHQSARRERPFVPINCAALPESLVESELFGHDRGAFSGAVTAKAGLFESVAGGTLFLDEVGDLAPPVQAKLLRAIETQRITRLGEHRERIIDVRVVAATHRVLEDEVAAGRFREDLYYRLSGARVVLPPLRDRRCEIPILFREFLARAAARLGRAAPEPSAAAMAALLAHDWPGNARELQKLACYLLATVTGDRIEPADLDGQWALRSRAPRATPAASSADPEPTAPAAMAASAAAASAAAASAAAASSAIASNHTPPGGVPMRRLADEVMELERRRMVEALAASGGVKTHAAQLLGMPIRTFTWKLKQLGIQ